jgi:hypothetical protein
MDTQTDQNKTGELSKSSPQPSSAVPSAPYETVLIKAFDKLTSQVFIFLLAYLILVIGLAVFAPQLVAEVRTILYALPVLGIGAYLWQQHRTLAGQAKRHGINVKAGITTGDARVTGVVSDADSVDLPKDVNVTAGLATGKSRVVGVVVGQEEAGDQAIDTQYLLETFQQLSAHKRRKLIASAQKLLDES